MPTAVDTAPVPPTMCTVLVGWPSITRASSADVADGSESGRVSSSGPCSTPASPDPDSASGKSAPLTTTASDALPDPNTDWEPSAAVS